MASFETKQGEVQDEENRKMFTRDTNLHFYT